MANSIQIVTDATFKMWINSFADLGTAYLPQEAIDEWELANELFFQETQAAAHILSGDMKRSGSMSVKANGMLVEGSISYGGGPDNVDYVKYELARGGSHDFIRRGYLKAEKTLQAGVGTALMAAIAAKFGG